MVQSLKPDSYVAVVSKVFQGFTLSFSVITSYMKQKYICIEVHPIS